MYNVHNTGLNPILSKLTYIYDLISSVNKSIVFYFL
jgi:hypothetical protein